jgi:hypothetical protein
MRRADYKGILAVALAGVGAVEMLTLLDIQESRSDTLGLLVA